MQTSWNDFIHQKLEQLTVKRERRPKIKYDPEYLILKDKSYLNFVSNDYLGLSGSKQLQNAFINASNRYGIGSTGAPSLSGYSDLHEVLSKNLAAWLGFDKCLLFNSGYQLGVGLYKQLSDNNTKIWLDKQIHASHIDGITGAKVQFSTFDQLSIDQVIKDILQTPQLKHVIVTEGSFSMDGSCSYLNKLIWLKQQINNNLLLIIDDAHGIGALGENGFGTLEQLGLNHQLVDLFIATFSKAFGSHGGFVCGNKILIEYLQQSVRSQMFSTCLPPAITAATIAALTIISSTEGLALRSNLTNNIAYFRSLSLEYNLPIYNYHHNISPIQLMIFNNENIVKFLFNKLLEHNILVGQMLYPTVARDAPRLRISLTANTLKPNIKLLCETLSTYMHKRSNFTVLKEQAII